MRRERKFRWVNEVVALAVAEPPEIDLLVDFLPQKLNEAADPYVPILRLKSNAKLCLDAIVKQPHVPSLHHQTHSCHSSGVCIPRTPHTMHVPTLPRWTNERFDCTKSIPILIQTTSPPPFHHSKKTIEPHNAVSTPSRDYPSNLSLIHIYEPTRPY